MFRELDADRLRQAANGAAYVYNRSGTIGTPIAYVKATNNQNEDRFGTRVAVSGSTIVASSPAEDSDATGINGDQDNNDERGSGAAAGCARTAAGALSAHAANVSWFRSRH
jgi:hypothetical protein